MQCKLKLLIDVELIVCKIICFRFVPYHCKYNVIVALFARLRRDTLQSQCLSSSISRMWLEEFWYISPLHFSWPYRVFKGGTVPEVKELAPPFRSWPKKGFNSSICRSFLTGTFHFQLPVPVPTYTMLKTRLAYMKSMLRTRWQEQELNPRNIQRL